MKKLNKIYMCVKSAHLSTANYLPVLKADALRFIVTFRSVLGKENLMCALPMIIELIGAPSKVVHTYAAHALERLLMIVGNGNQPL